MEAGGRFGGVCKAKEAGALERGQPRSTVRNQRLTAPTVLSLWERGCRAGGAAPQGSVYQRQPKESELPCRETAVFQETATLPSLL